MGRILFEPRTTNNVANRTTRLVLLTMLLVVAVATISMPPAVAESVVATIPVGTGPYLAGVNSTTNKIYVTNFNSNSVSVIDGATDTVTSTVPVGGYPTDAGVNPTTNKIYVTNYGGNTVSVIDGVTDTVTGTVTVGSAPWGAGVNPTTNKIYVANFGTFGSGNTVSVIDGSTDTVINTVTVGSCPTGVGVNPTTNKIYVANYNAGTVSVIDGSTDTVTSTVTVRTHPWCVGVNPTTNKIYVANNVSGNVSVINGSTDTVTTTVTVGTNPTGVAVNPAMNRVYVANNGSGSNSVSIMDGSTDTVGKTCSVGSNPMGAGANPVTSRIYVPNNVGNDVSVIYDPPTYTITASAGANGSISPSGSVTVDSWDDQVFDMTPVSSDYRVADVLVDGSSVGDVTSYTFDMVSSDHTIDASFELDVDITSVSPVSGAQGQVMSVDIVGKNTSFVDDTSVASFGAGITVNSTEVTDPAHATANITISGSAVPGTRNVNVTTGGETPDPLVGGFTVRDAKITSVSPVSGAQGQAMDVAITGTNTNFINGTSAATFGSGITVNSTTVTNSTHATANITISASAASTARSVNVITGGETPDRLVGGFTVRDAKILYVSQKSGGRGQTMDVIITGTNTGFVNGTSMASFGDGVTVNKTTVTDATHATANITVSGSAVLGTRDVNVTTAGETPDKLLRCFTVVEEIVPPAPVTTSPVWYLAEGSSDYGFDTYITIENPNDNAVTAAVTYMTKAGPRSRPDLNLPSMSQMVINPRDDVGATDFSTRVECKEGKTIAVDRRMIWTGPGAPSQEGHCSVGVTAPAQTWYLPEGSASWGFECWLLIQNPNDSEAVCQVTYMIENVGPRTVEKRVPANSRNSFNMADDMQDVAIKDASIKVESNVPVIPERAMYRNNRREGHDSIGTTTPAEDYYLAEGCTGWGPGFITYVLVQNPQASTNRVTVTYLTGTGREAGPTFDMPANSRKTIRVNDQLPPDTDVSTLVHGEKPIIAERAMYWDNGQGEACHDSVGMDSAHTNFYLPDGETSSDMETWTLVSNPNISDVEVRITYLTPSGIGNVSFNETIPANSRKTYNMAEKVALGRAAVLVQSFAAGDRVMVERAMYWNKRGAGTDTIGGYAD